MTKQTEIIEATLTKIIFKNDNGFIIAAFLDHKNNKITALGNMINPQVNMDYILSGYWTEDYKFGEQFKFSSYESIVPVDTSGIFKYIVRVCKYVGGAVGNKIVDKYGEKTLSVMKTNPEKLAHEISGITLDRAKKIQASLLENEATEKIMVELETILDVHGMRKNLPGELIKTYKSNAAEAVKQNPYILSNFRGISFFLADLVALNIGYARDSVYRKSAAAYHVMLENQQAGSVWIRREDLLTGINELIQVPVLIEGVESLEKDSVIIEDSGCYALIGAAEDEMLIGDIVVEMAGG